MEGAKLTIWTMEDETDAKAALPSLQKTAAKVVTVSQEVLTKNLQEFLQTIEPLTAVDTSKESPFYVDEFQLTLAVDANGGIELVGKLEAGVQAGITITLKRKTK